MLGILHTRRFDLTPARTRYHANTDAGCPFGTLPTSTTIATSCAPKDRYRGVQIAYISVH